VCRPRHTQNRKNLSHTGGGILLTINNHRQGAQTTSTTIKIARANITSNITNQINNVGIIDIYSNNTDTNDINTSNDTYNNLHPQPTAPSTATATYPATNLPTPTATNQQRPTPPTTY
jgi:hypothetical protein